MKASIIIIGTEILSGEGLDTNSQFLARSLNELGINVVMRITPPDSADIIISAIKTAKAHSDVLIITGGLGPTNDDITKKVLCNYYETELIIDSNTLDHIKSLFNRRNIKLNENNLNQALVPKNATILKNQVGTAPGLLFENKEGITIALPGVPFEMKHLFDKWVKPLLIDKVSNKIFHKNIHTSGIPESVLAGKLNLIDKSLPQGVTIAFLPNLGQVKIRVTSTGKEPEIARSNLDKVKSMIEHKVSKYIFGYDNDSLETVLGKMLSEKNATLSTAESCTGGYISHMITSVPGSSGYYEGSIISYSNDIKMNELNVSEQTLINHGAVSRQTVEQMVVGVINKFGTTYGISTSGIAGPGGGTDEKPVGTVWIAVGSKNKIISKMFQFDIGRIQNIKRTANIAMNMLRLFILE